MPQHDHGTPKILRPYLIPQDEERYPIEPRKIPAPVPEPGILDEPVYCLQVNHLWMVHLLGVIDVLANRDTWEGDDSEKQRALDEIEILLNQMTEPCHPCTDPEAQCVSFYPNHPRFEFNPGTINGIEDPPIGYALHPWYTGDNQAIIPGLLATDVLCDVNSTRPSSPGAFIQQITQSGFPRFRFRWTGPATVELHFIKVPLGGFAVVRVDETADVDIIELTSVRTGDITDYLSFILSFIDGGLSATFVPIYIREKQIEGEGEHIIDVVIIPYYDFPANVGWGGGIRKIVICGPDVDCEDQVCPDCPDCGGDCDDCGCDDETPEEPDDCDCGCGDDDTETPEEPEVPEEDEEMFIGTIIAYPSGKAPVKAGQKWVACDGDNYPQVEYPEFHAEFTDLQNDEFSFHVPDLRDRFILGVGTGDIDQEGGAATHTLTEAELPSHTHLQNAHTHVQDAHTHLQNAHTHVQDAHNHTQAAHSHSLNAGNAAGSTANTVSRTSITAGTVATDSQTPTINNATATNQNTTATNQNTTAVNQNATATNQNTGGGTAHNNMPPYLTLGYYIRIK